MVGATSAAATISPSNHFVIFPPPDSGLQSAYIAAMSGRSADTREYEHAPADAKEHRDGGHWIGDVWRRLGTNGTLLGTNGGEWRAFLAPVSIAAVGAGVAYVINIVTTMHAEPR